MVETTSNDTLLRRFASGTMYTGIGTGLRIIAGVVSTKILATYLPSSEFGQVILIELVAGFLRMLSECSIGIASIRSLVTADREEQKIIVDTVVIFRFIMFLLVALVFLFTQRWVYLLFSEEAADNMTFLILAFTFVMAYEAVLKQMLQGFFRFKQMVLIELGGSVLSVGLVAVSLIGLKAGLVGVVLARILASGVGCVLFYLSLPTPKGLSFCRNTLGQMLRFSWPLQVNEVLTFVFSSFGTLTVATVMTPGDVALLAIASTIPEESLSSVRSLSHCLLSQPG